MSFSAPIPTAPLQNLTATRELDSWLCWHWFKQGHLLPSWNSRNTDDLSNQLSSISSSNKLRSSTTSTKKSNWTVSTGCSYTQNWQTEESDLCFKTIRLDWSHSPGYTFTERQDTAGTAGPGEWDRLVQQDIFPIHHLWKRISPNHIFTSLVQ